MKKLSRTKPIVVDDRFVFVSIKPKANNVYIPHFKRNHKENAYFARLDKGKSSNVDIEVSKPMSKPPIREQNKYVFVPTCHFCGVFGHIRPNCFLLRQNQNLGLDLLLGILMFLNLFLFVIFVGISITFVLTVINWNLRILCLSLGYVMIYLLLQVLINYFIWFWNKFKLVGVWKEIARF